MLVPYHHFLLNFVIALQKFPLRLQIFNQKFKDFYQTPIYHFLWSLEGPAQPLKFGPTALFPFYPTTQHSAVSLLGLL